MKKRLLIFNFLLAVFLYSCNTKEEIVKPSAVKDYNAEVVLKWSKLFLDIDRYAPGYRPPVAARSLGYMGLAGYEAVVSGTTNYQSIQSGFSGLKIPAIESGRAYHWPTTVNAAYTIMMKKFFPHMSAVTQNRIDSLSNALNAVFEAQTDKGTFDRSKKHGELVASAVFDWSKTDAVGHEAYINPQPTSYTPPSGIGKWKPTFPDYGRALLPNWGKTRTFAINEADKVAKAPIPYSTRNNSLFYAQGLEVYAQGDTYENRWIGEFWSDDIFELTFEPAARWLAVGMQVLAQEKSNLETAVLMVAKLGMALSDGGVACWNSKYLYNVERPITFIRATIDPNWITLLNNPLKRQKGVTPPFPSYPSGHSTFGSAAAEVLSDIFNYKYTMTDRCHEYRLEFNGKPRTFSSFYQMAEENAVSRIMLGVHYRMDCDEGLRIGYLAGKKVNALKWKK